MISFAIAEPVGNAVRIILAPPAGAAIWRLLRKAGDTFTGYNDANALLVHEGESLCVFDTQSIANGQVYYYRAYYLVGGLWVASSTVSVTPAATFVGGLDAYLYIRDRLDLGLRALVARGVLHHPRTHIPVLLAPPAFEETPLPVVTLHLSSESSAERGIGEIIKPDKFNVATGKWSDHEGWLARLQLAIIGWSMNPDERATLRSSIRDVLIANLPVFDAVGIVQVDFSQQDVEDFQSFNIPMYQTVGDLTCLAPVTVESEVGSIREVVPFGAQTILDAG